MQRRINIPPMAAFVLKSAAILLATLGCSFLASQMGINKESILMIFLLGTVLTHVVTPGYWYGLTTAGVLVAIYCYQYVVPLQSFSVSRPSDIMMLVTFFITSFLCGTITNRLTLQREISENNARTAKQMQQVTEGFLQVTGEKAIVMQGIHCLKEHAGLECAVSLRSGMAYPQAASPGGVFYAVPITGTSKTLGTLNAYPSGHITFAQELLLKAVAAQMAGALERDSFYIEQEKIRMTVERERLRSTLLRAVAHDLRSPLTVLAGASGLLSGNIQVLTDPEKAKLAKDINEEVIWLTDLVENILSMTQIQESRLFLRRQEEVVDDAVNEAVKHVSPLLQGKKFSVTLPEEVVTAPMDIRLVTQVIINLLDNAVRHTPPGCAVSLNVIPSEKEVIFEVCDDGPGIDPAIRDTLFEGFTQKSIKVLDGQRGLGLGLAICQAVVSAHDGTIKAENRPEGGSRFVFTLPRGEG